VRWQGKIVAFVNILLGADKHELSLDLMRHLPEAPHGIMEYLFTQLMLWGKREGYRWFSLGMAPLAGLEARPLAPLWNRLAGLVFRHGEHFYNFQGLRQFKEKFDPEWEPRYLAASSGLALPRILANIAALTSRGLKGVIAK
jgi:phosphatidylglycerol lysyltransferase